MAGTALASGTGSANLSATASAALAKNWPPGIQGKLTINQPTLTLVLAYDLNVLFASPDEDKKAHDERGGWSAFWSGVVQVIKYPKGVLKASWASLSTKIKQEIVKTLGESNLKGSRTFSMGFGWEDIPFETPIWRLPLG